MCGPHWRRVPRDIQRRVWATYRRGQCDDKNASYAWHAAADRAIAAVARKEGYEEAADRYERSAETWEVRDERERKPQRELFE